MKKTAIIISLFLLGIPFSGKAQEMTQKEKNSYSIGVLLGKKVTEEIQKSGIDLSIINSIKEKLNELFVFESLKEGLNDVLNGECKLTKEEIEATLVELQKKKDYLEQIIKGNQDGESEAENTFYAGLIKEAFTLYESKEYLQAGQKYAEAFTVLGEQETGCCDRYNAACSWALANETDSAFIQLFIIANNGSYPKLEHITTDADLNSLHQDKRWAEVIEMIKYKTYTQTLLSDLEELEKANAIPEKSKADVEKIRKMLRE